MHDFTWFELISHGKINHHNIHIFSAGLVVFFLMGSALLIHRKLKRVEERVIPAPKMTLVNLFEAAVENILGLMEGILGHDAPKYLPLIGTLFIYIFLCNVLALIPGFVPPTDNVNTNFAMALTVFLYYHAVGIKTHGVWGYLRHFLGPIQRGPWWAWFGIVPFMVIMLVVEMIGNLVRPVSLSLRLFGNITGDHLVIGIFSDLVPILVPVIFLALGLFVSFIQAFVFSLLSMIYISLATAHEEHSG